MRTQPDKTSHSDFTAGDELLNGAYIAFSVNCIFIWKNKTKECYECAE